MMNATEWLIENGRYHTIGKDIIFSINTKDMEQYAEYVHSERSKLHLVDVSGSKCNECNSTNIIPAEFTYYCKDCKKVYYR